MTPTEAFLRARDVLLANADDLERARAEFRWPALVEFNWAWDWFEVLARGNESPALVRVSETDGVTTVATPRSPSAPPASRAGSPITAWSAETGSW